MNAWVNTGVFTYQYDSHGNQILNQYQSLIEGVLNYLFQSTAEYDSSGNLFSGTYQTFSNNMWVNSAHFYYTFDSNQYQITGVNQSWNMACNI